MKTRAFGVAAVLGLVTASFVVSAEQGGGVSAESYAIGHDLGAQTLDRLRADGVEIEMEALLRGIEDGLRESPAALSEAEMEDLLAALHRRVVTREAEARVESDPVFRALATENERRGREFLSRFGAQENVVRLDGGIVCQSLKAGDGARVGAEDTVRVTYKGELLDGTVFGEAKDRELRVTSTLEGGQRALAKMRVGDRWIVAIPAELAFGIGGRAPDIGPNETIVIDVEVLGIN